MNLNIPQKLNSLKNDITGLKHGFPKAVKMKSMMSLTSLRRKNVGSGYGKFNSDKLVVDFIFTALAKSYFSPFTSFFKTI
jgi:hypothetical protein